MPYDPFDNPFLQLGQGRGPALLPQEESSKLGALLESSLGGLGYLGKVLDKTFGGRAARGLFGGRPQELASVLPFSDTLGLTNEQDAVQGTDLARQFGLIDPGDDSFGAQAIGFGAEVATDPATWFGAAVPRLVGKGAGMAGRGLGAATEALTGLNPYSYGVRKLSQGYDAAKIPVKALFNPPSGGAWTGIGQGLAENQYTPALKAGQQTAQDSYASARVDLSDLFGKVNDPAVLRRALLQNSEGFETSARQTLAAGGMDPASIDQAIDIGRRFSDQTRQVTGMERGVGAVSKEFQDVPDWVRSGNEAAQAAGQPLPYPGDLPTPGYQPALYAPRTLAPWGDDAGVSRYAAQGMSGKSQFQANREDFLRGIPGGTDAINQLASDPRLSGVTRTLSDLDVESHLQQLLTGQAHFNSPAKEQAAQLSEWLKGLPSAAQTHGVFSDDVLGSGLVRQLEGARVHATGQTVIEGLSQFSEPVAALEARGVRYKTVPDVLQQMGLTHTDVNGVPVAADAVAGRLGMQGTFNMNALKGMAVPEDVAQDMARIGQAWKTPAVLAPVVDFWDKTVNLFKTYLTAPFAGFHFRNMMSGIFNMWRDGVDPTKGLAAGADAISMLRGGTLSPEVAAKLYPNMPLDLATKEFQKELVAHRLAFVGNNQTTDLAGKQVLTSPLPAVGGAVRPLSQDAGDFGAGFKTGWSNPLDTENFPLARQGRAVGNTVEDWIRSTHYLANREKGLSPADAAAQVQKYQIDYSNLTEFERSVMKRLFPWYCMPVDHEILTRAGFKFYDQLTVGEEVMARTADGKLVWTPLLEVAEFDYDGDLMVFESRGASFEFTPNHRWVTTTPRYRQAEIREAVDLNTTHSVVMSGEFDGADTVLSPRLAAILGWVVTDGHMRWVGQNCEMVIYQSEKKAIDDIRELLGVDPRQASDDRQEHRVYTFAVPSADVAALTCVIQSKSQVADVACGLSVDAAEAMYQAMMAAEGSMSKIGQECFAQSPKNHAVRDAFQIVCLLTGRLSFQSKAGCYLRKKKVFGVKDWMARPRRYTGKIWCPKTEHGTWIVRHAGAISVTGNTFSRRSLPPLLEDLANNPAKVAGATRLLTGVRQPGDFVPPWIAEGASIPLPGAPDGQQRYISSFGLPMEDELVKTLGSAMQGDPQRVFQQLFGMSQPFVKLPAEIATGVQMYSGRKLEDLKPYQSLTLGGLIPDDTARIATQVVGNSPASRFFSTADKLTDPRKSLIDTGINTLTGARITDVDTDKVKERVAQDLLKKMLSGKPGVRTSEDVYVPQDQIQKLTPDDLMEYNLLKEIQRRSQARSRAEKSAR